MSQTNNITDGCLLWARAVTTDDYGKVHWGGRTLSAHRLLYELEHGDIPNNMTIHHKCFTPRCINIEHLEVVSNKVNILASSGFSAINAKKTQCANGHEFTPENTLIVDGKRRRCRKCNVIWWRNSMARRK